MDVDCAALFDSLGVGGMLAVFKSMLHEGHTVFVSADLPKLSTCCQAAASLLDPLHWQHIFVPVLPRAWLGYVTAPMPFMLGVHSSMFDEVSERQGRNGITASWTLHILGHL